MPIVIPKTSNEHANRREQTPRAATPAQDATSAIDSTKKTKEYTTTDMGRRTDHTITQIWLDLEETPAQMMNIRYEFRPQLVKLSILPPAPATDPLQRHERTHGFEPTFYPEPKR